MNPLDEALRQPWRIDIEGHTLSDGEMTADEAVVVEGLVGEGWPSLHPLSGPRALRALAVVCLVSKAGMDLGAATVRVGAMSVEKLLAGLIVGEGPAPEAEPT